MPTLGSNLLRFESNGSAPNLPGAPQIGSRPDGLADWYYRNMRDAAAYQAYLAKNFVHNCIRNANQIDGNQVARDAVTGGLRGGIRGGVKSTFRFGPEAAPAGAARGFLGGAAGGAAKSALRQACDW